MFVKCSFIPPLCIPYLARQPIIHFLVYSQPVGWLHQVLIFRFLGFLTSMSIAQFIQCCLFHWTDWATQTPLRENLKQAPCSVWSLTQASVPWPWDHDLSRNQESDTQLTEPPRCPFKMIFKRFCLNWILLLNYCLHGRYLYSKQLLKLFQTAWLKHPVYSF